ncbi:MAG TPA: EamA family transporter [Gaiellaceae bacterium]|nr:EamA family transporter [Gaiellaceae bacterium]
MAEIVEVLPGARAPAGRRHRLGYAMVLVAAALFAINGVVSKVILAGGEIDPKRLTELRSTGAFLGLAVVLLAFAPSRLRVSREELPLLVFYGICGFALVQWSYFVAIERLPVGIALLLQFTAPVLVALWARFGRHERVRRRVWAALALTLVGLTLVSQAWLGLTLDGVGVAAALLASVSLAIYFVVGEHGVGLRDPLSLVCLAFLVAALFWAAVQPWWSFPFGALTEPTSLFGNLADVSLPVWLLALWMIGPGTIVPFALSIGALRHLPATIVGVAATAEPPLAALAAYLWLDETLAAMQVVGGLVVLLGIGLAQTARPPAST